MARPAKTHIRSPLNGRESICGRMSVQFADSPSQATCKTCHATAATGEYERQSIAKKFKGSGKNQSGQPKLTEMQRAFAAHPEVTTNPRKAALEAGYSKLFAKSHSKKLRQQLSGLITQYQEEALQKTALSVARVQQEFAALGFANIVDYFDIMEDGSMLPKKLSDLTREQTAAIQEMKVVEIDTENGREFRVGYIKLADKRANLVELGKTMGIFNPKAADDDDHARKEMLRDVPTEALEEAERLLMTAVKESRELRSKSDAVEGEFKVLPEPEIVDG